MVRKADMNTVYFARYLRSSFRLCKAVQKQSASLLENQENDFPSACALRYVLPRGAQPRWRDGVAHTLTCICRHVLPQGWKLWEERRRNWEKSSSLSVK